MASPFFTIDAVKTVALVGPIISGVITVVRLSERIYTQRFGHDDAWAAFSLILMILFDAALFTHLGDPIPLTHTTRISLFYILAQTFYGVVWTARMSILFSVIRICPPSFIKKFLWALAASFVVIWIILFAQVFWVCEAEPGWKDPLVPQCALGQSVAIAQVISDVYADLMLIAAPLRLLWNLRTTPGQKNRLIFVFTASFTTTIASLIHSFYVLRVGGIAEVFIAIIEMSVSLMICNLAVVVTLGARMLSKFTGADKNNTGKNWYSMSRSQRTATSDNSTIGTRTADPYGTKSLPFDQEASSFDSRPWNHKNLKGDGVRVDTTQFIDVVNHK